MTIALVYTTIKMKIKTSENTHSHT